MFNFLLFLPIVNAIIKGYNFYGLETQLKDFTCSWKHPPDFYIDKLSELGFNSVRVPFSVQWVNEGDYHKMDDFIEIATHKNMSILFRPTPC